MTDALLVVNVPLRVVSALNAREPWQAKARRVRSERTVTGTYLRKAGPGALALCRVALTLDRGLDIYVTRVAPRGLDVTDNLPSSVKGVIDEIAAWLGLPNDRDPRVTWHVRQEKRGPQFYEVKVEVFERAASEIEQLRAEVLALRAKLAGAAE